MRMMSPSLVISLAITFIAITKASNIATAVFTAGTGKLTGHISALNGFIWMDLDFSQVNWTAFPENCSLGGLGYHVHNKWSYGADTSDKTLADCHKDYTGNHYDPWFACGAASDSADCVNNGGCIPSSTIYNQINENLDNHYECSPANYSEVAYTCEVGDWSGKYGVLEPDETTGKVVRVGNDTDGSYWEPSMYILFGVENYGGDSHKSVVIHCNDGSRAFCAPVTREQSSEESIDLTDDQTIETVFDDAGEAYTGMAIKWKSSGGRPQIELTFPASMDGICSSWDLYLYNDWPYDAYGGRGGETAAENCDLAALGGIFDPTHTCIDESASKYCWNGVRCNATNAAYSCDAATEYFGCAVGDIVGRIGSVSSTSASIEDPKSPPLFVLGDKAIVFVCADNGVDINLCALTEQTNGTVIFGTPSPTGDDAHGFGGKLSFLWVVMASVSVWMMAF